MIVLFWIVYPPNLYIGLLSSNYFKVIWGGGSQDWRFGLDEVILDRLCLIQYGWRYYTKKNFTQKNTQREQNEGIECVNASPIKPIFLKIVNELWEASGEACDTLILSFLKELFFWHLRLDSDL